MGRFSRLLLIALLAVVAGFYPLLAPTPHRIDREHFDLIQVGMTKAEVEAIFGVPPGSYDWAEAESYFHVMRVRAAVQLEMAEMLQRRATAQSQRKATTETTTELAINLEHARAMERQAAAEVMFEILARVSETWASRHGAFTVRFDNDGRVVSKTDAWGVRIVPPWQRWWKAIRGQ